MTERWLRRTGPYSFELTDEPGAQAAKPEDAGQHEGAADGREAAPGGEGADEVGGVGGRAEEKPSPDLAAAAVLQRLEEADADDGVAHTEAAGERAHARGLGVAAHPRGAAQTWRQEQACADAHARHRQGPRHLSFIHRCSPSP